MSGLNYVAIAVKLFFQLKQLHASNRLEEGQISLWETN